MNSADLHAAPRAAGAAVGCAESAIWDRTEGRACAQSVIGPGLRLGAHCRRSARRASAGSVPSLSRVAGHSARMIGPWLGPGSGMVCVAAPRRLVPLTPGSTQRSGDVVAVAGYVDCCRPHLLEALRGLLESRRVRRPQVGERPVAGPHGDLGLAGWAWPTRRTHASLPLLPARGYPRRRDQAGPAGEAFTPATRGMTAPQ